jgi:hypothetical protein
MVSGLAFLLVSVSLAKAQTAETVLEKYADAVGGKDSFAALKSRIARGEFNLPDLGAQGQLEAYSIPPDKSFTSIDFSGMGTVTNGVNGNVVWDMNPMVGPRILEGRERVGRLRQVQFDQFVEWNRHFNSAEVVGESELAGSPCTKVKLTPAEGEPLTCCFDNISGLIVRIETVAGEQNLEITLSDYRVVDGVKIAHKVETKSPLLSSEMILKSVEHNVDISDSRFELPPEIRSLMESTN